MLHRKTAAGNSLEGGKTAIARFSFGTLGASCAGMAKSGRLAATKIPRGIELERIAGQPGFVRVGRTSTGQCWLIDGDGRPFFSRGVANVNRQGRESGRGAQPTAYERAVEQKYGPDGAPKFGQAVRERLRAWQGNTFGLGSDPEVFSPGWFFLAGVGFRQAAPETVIKLAGASLPDVFDPRWVRACETLAEEVCAPRQHERDLIGYCTDRDLHWSQPARGLPARRPERPSLLQICLSLEPGFAAYHAAWEFALAPYGGELAALARAWNIEPNREALRQLTLADSPLTSAGYLADQERFTREFARRYFQTCSAAIRRADPNHLVLGCEFAASPGAAVLAESVNPALDGLLLVPEEVDVFGAIERVAQPTGLPVLISGFSWVTEAFVATPLAPRRVTTVERMLANGRASLTRAFSHPALIGYTWSDWADAPDDVPPFGRGLVHADDREAREHTELLTELNLRADACHRLGHG